MARFGSTRFRDAAELDQIESPFSQFDFRDPTVWHVEPPRKLPLGKPGPLPHFKQFGPESRILRRMNGFLHCSQYGNTLRCFQIRSMLFGRFMTPEEGLPMQVVPNYLPLVRINAPEIYADDQFAEWLNTVTANGRKELPGFRTASWHWPGHEPGEESDIFMLVDGPDGSDSDMPEHCWQIILEAVSRAIPNTYPECIVWLTNLDPVGIGDDGFTFSPTRRAEVSASESVSSEHAAVNRCETQRLGELPKGFDAEASRSTAQPLRVPLDIRRPHVMLRSILSCAARNGVQGEVAQHLIGATLTWQMNRRSSPAGASDSGSMVRHVPRIRGFEVENCMFTIALDRPECRRLEELRELLMPADTEIWIITSTEHFGSWFSMASDTLCNERVVVTTIESFIGQSIARDGGFSSEGTSAALAAIIKTYNRCLIDAVEDPRLRIVVNEAV